MDQQLVLMMLTFKRHDTSQWSDLIWSWNGATDAFGQGYDVITSAQVDSFGTGTSGS